MAPYRWWHRLEWVLNTWIVPLAIIAIGVIAGLWLLNQVGVIHL